jgi:hypothetical protein
MKSYAAAIAALSLISVEHKASWNHYILPPNFIKFRPLAF